MSKPAKRKLQFSLRAILLLMLFAAPVSVYIAHVRNLPETAVMKASVHSDGTVEIDGRRDTLDKMMPILDREISRRQHFEHGAELHLFSLDGANEAAFARVIDAAENVGRINLVRIYPIGDIPIPVYRTPGKHADVGMVMDAAKSSDSPTFELSQETQGNNQE